MFFTAIFLVVAIKIIEVNLFNTNEQAVFNKSYETEFSWNKKTLENIRKHHEVDLETFNYE